MNESSPSLLHHGELFPLLGSVLQFLEECGGPYGSITQATQVNILFSLACGQYVLRKRDGAILYFGCFWRIWPEDLDTIRSLDRPDDIYTGPLVYVVEAGNQGTKRDIAEMARRLKNQNADAVYALWHRRGKLEQFKLSKGGCMDVEHASNKGHPTSSTGIGKASTITTPTKSGRKENRYEHECGEAKQ